MLVIVQGKHFDINGTSYIGAPRSYTAMFITRKIEHLLGVLESVDGCLVFAETGIVASDRLENKHAFIFSGNPLSEYAKFAKQFEKERFENERKFKFNLLHGGYYQCEDSIVSEDAYIEPGCVIGPDVQIGKNARIFAGCIIRRATIGENFIANENAVIGSNGFTMAEDENGNKFRIPTLGRVIIGNNVEIGAHDNISCGTGGDTVIEDNTKLDALVHLGHDAHLKQNVEITAGGIIGGFDNLGDHVYVGINATLRNRINIGDNAVIGMGSTVTKSVEANITIAGNPAKLFEKNEQKQDMEVR